MSAEAHAQNPSADSDATLISALATHHEKLRPGSLGDLARLWRSELAGSPASVIEDLVAARLANPRYAHFLAATDSTTASAAPAVAPQPEIVMNAGRPSLTISDQLRARVQATRQTAAPGLAGDYGLGRGA